MRGKLTSIVVSLVGGPIGGAMSRGLIVPGPVAFAQGQTQGAKVVRAERIELINKQGRPLAVWEVGCNDALPAGFSLLTLDDKDEKLHQERKLVLTTTVLDMKVGDDSAIMAPGGRFMFSGSASKSGGGIGAIPPTFRPGVFIYSPEGVTTLDSGRLNIADKAGRSIAAVP